MANRVVHFEIHADDLQRAKAFYETVFGWQFTKWDTPQEYWLITTGSDNEPGINGGMVKRMGPPPAADNPVSAFVCTVDVQGIDAVVEAATRAGGRIALPKMAVPGVGWLAYIGDTEGNIVGLMTNDPQAR
jgi:predicted enzyme related to lactoylglutathione lyase